ncbi:hypothetical protein TspCOW1_12860 [Thiohalobacter sp. COW1]|uniref:GIY-YIG nuclease family protein n=1 Tax=Thiohalobacter sp. COW1 TaxID=2795687 RepID=UPI00191627AC|nr:GIY-YIG nuclease family protein [Thiohalobacter sp. COW1]BCO31183.1 hypothetical protein TspCOW1_12860 [Thiohalobacter sp. COW1]
MNRLIELGFECVGHWKLADDRPVFELTNQVNAKNVLYAFVSNGDIKYIGKTTQTLKGRMASYQNPGPSQSTNIKNNENIKTLLKAGEAVDIFVLPDSGLLHYGGFNINLAAGLEDSLISDISPPWNGRPNAIQEPENTVNDSEASPVELTVYKQNAELNAGTESRIDDTIFHFQLRVTYYNQGFFNVPTKYMKLFGADRDKIEIYCGESKQLIQGYINRSVNKSNAPRIMGGTQLRQWFGQNFEIDNPVQVEVLSPTSIWLRRGTIHVANTHSP